MGQVKFTGGLKLFQRGAKPPLKYTCDLKLRYLRNLRKQLEVLGKTHLRGLYNLQTEIRTTYSNSGFPDLKTFNPAN